jgi:hypothetical protein
MKMDLDSSGELSQTPKEQLVQLPNGVDDEKGLVRIRELEEVIREHTPRYDEWKRKIDALAREVKNMKTTFVRCLMTARNQKEPPFRIRNQFWKR